MALKEEKEENKGMSPEQLEALLLNVKELTDKVKTLEVEKGNKAMSIEEVVKALNRNNPNAPVEKSEYVFKESDFLDEDNEVHYFAPVVWYLINTDERKGVMTEAPTADGSGVILFEYVGEDVVKTSRGKSNSVFSRFVCKNKHQQEWLENHTLFGTKFFKDRELAIHANPAFIEVLVRIAASVNAMEPGALILAMQQSGLAPTQNYETNCTQYTLYHARKEIEKIKAEKDASGMYAGGEFNDDEFSRLFVPKSEVANG